MKKRIPRFASILGRLTSIVVFLLLLGNSTSFGAGDNAPIPEEEGKEQGESQETSDADEEADAGNTDCDGTSGSNDPSCNGSGNGSGDDCPNCGDDDEEDTNPDDPSCIKEQVMLSVAPNQPGLEKGMLQLYIDRTGSNLASLDFVSYYAVPEMFVNSTADSGTETKYSIIQAGGSAIPFAVDKAGSSLGKPTGASAYSQARLSFVDAGGTTSGKSSAASVRQYRGSNGFGDYPVTGGLMTKYQTRQGRSYSFPLTGMEVIRKNSAGALLVNVPPTQGSIRQVKTAAGLLDIVPLTTRSYEVRKYAPAQIGPKSAGLYTVLSAPIRTMKVEAPANTQNKLIITKTTGSVQTVAVNTCEIEDGYEVWRQVVTAGSFEFERVLSRTPKPELGAEYFANQKLAFLRGVPGGTSPQGGGGGGAAALYTQDSTTKGYAPVSSSQKFASSGATDKRELSFSKPQWDTNGTGRPATSKSSNGTEKSYSYDDSSGKMGSREFKTSRSGGGGSAPVSFKSSFDYTPQSPGETRTPADFRPSISTVVEDGKVVSKKYFSAFTEGSAYKERRETVTDLASAYGAASNRYTQKEWYGSGVHKGRISHIRSDDGSVTRFEYLDLPANGLQVTTSRNLDSAGNPVAGYSTRKVEKRDARGWVVETVNAASVSGAWVDYEKLTDAYNDHGRMTSRVRTDLLGGQIRTLMSKEWDGYRLLREVDEQGVATSYTYFEDSSVIKTIRREEVPAAGGFPTQPEILTTYSGTFTLNEKQSPEWLERITTTTAGGLTLTESHTFDHEGRVVSHTDRNQLTTTTVYTENDNLITVTNPDLSQKITAMDSRGRVLSVTGSAVVDEFYHYQVRTAGGWIETTYYGQDNGPRYRRTLTDAAGRTVEQSGPAFGGIAQTVTGYAYGTSQPGEPETITRSGDSTRIQTFNAIGRKERSGLSADDASLSLDSATDRIVDEEPVFAQDASGLWRVTTRYVYPDAGFATRKFHSAIKVKIGGFSGSEIARKETSDIASNITSDITTLVGAVTTYSSLDPERTDTSVSRYHADRLMNISAPGYANPKAFGYDAFGRETSEQNPRHVQPMEIAYIPGKNQAASRTDAAGNLTSYTYYPQGVVGAGKIRSVTLADNTVAWHTYTLRGEYKATWGSQTNPTWRIYDDLGQLTTLHTWQVSPALDADEMPATVPAGSVVTIWIYDPSSGLLASKRDDSDKGADYQFDIAGRLGKRTWARATGGQPLITDYGYTGFGQLSTIDYSDNTPDVNQTYDRLGRVGLAGNTIATSSFTYDPATLLPDTETVTYDLNADSTPELVRVLDRSQDAYLRADGFELKNGVTVEKSAKYGYQPASGRLATVGTQATPAMFTYQYEPDSDLIESVLGPAHTVTNDYETNRDILTKKTNGTGGPAISDYTYIVNSIGQRSDVNQTGSGFATARSITWGYDPLGQLETADSTIPGLDRAYSYNQIGNRLKYSEGTLDPNDAAAVTYSPNALNQYTSVGTSVPAYDLDGNATSYPLPSSPAANSTLGWDAENRMVEAVRGSDTATFAYDGGSRRIAKTSGGVTTLYLYDGWNPVAEYVGGALTKSFLWGMDLSGSRQGAGGVGGLLAVNDGSASYYPTYDANGNVSEYLDSTGAVVAHYEYDPFGITTVATGTKIADFAHRFSTKPLDPETGLYYYGYRYYDPVTGRWPSRDPIGEDGGINLYAFLGNNGVNLIDVLGLAAPGNHDHFPNETAEELLERKKCFKGRLTKEQKAELKKIDTSLKAKDAKGSRHSNSKKSNTGNGTNNQTSQKGPGDPHGQGSDYSKRNPGSTGQKPPAPPKPPTPPKPPYQGPSGPNYSGGRMTDGTGGMGGGWGRRGMTPPRQPNRQ